MTQRSPILTLWRLEKKSLTGRLRNNDNECLAGSNANSLAAHLSELIKARVNTDVKMQSH